MLEGTLQQLETDQHRVAENERPPGALEARRRHLLNKVRSSGSSSVNRVAQIRPAEQLTAWTRTLALGRGRTPLTGSRVWLFAIDATPARVLASVGWMTGLLALASRATTVLRVIAQLRAVYRSLKARDRADCYGVAGRSLAPVLGVATGRWVPSACSDRRGRRSRASRPGGGGVASGPWWFDQSWLQATRREFHSRPATSDAPGPNVLRRILA